jgi:cell division septum initiation protein DivIVA
MWLEIFTYTTVKLSNIDLSLRKNSQMLRQNFSSRNDSESDQPRQFSVLPQSRAVGFDIQRELDRLEEMILDSSRIPLTGKTLIDEDKLLNQLDLVRISLPDAFEKALEVIQQEQQILQEAENYAKNMIAMAQQQAAQILDETGIVQQAQEEANQIRQQLQKECEAAQRQTIAEIEQRRTKAQQELQQLHQQTMTSCQEIQAGADEYADAVLTQIEQQLNEMMRVVRNGRQQLCPNSPAQNSPPKRLPGNSSSRSRSHLKQ